MKFPRLNTLREQFSVAPFSCDVPPQSRHVTGFSQDISSMKLYVTLTIG